MIFKRELTKALKQFSTFPIVGVFGPRQSGKTTLVKNTFKKHVYLNFEDPNIRLLATENPRSFLHEHENKHGIILDEFQYVPQILSYIQLEADTKDRPGYFVLTGSQNFLMNRAITQSLAGRIGILTLLPLSIKEMQQNKLLKENVNEMIVSGGYPRLYAKKMTLDQWYPSYIHSYLERDIRQLVNVSNLATFQKFMRLCAGRIGQLLNISDLATTCGIDQKTVKNWLSILEASYIIFFLNPYHVNFKKRIIKTPKLFFYDTGIACSLLKIRSLNDLTYGHFRGHLFENFIMADLFKQYYNLGREPSLYFWRDHNGRLEIDCLVDEGEMLTPIEIKSSETINTSFFDNLTVWKELANIKKEYGFLVYGGDVRQQRSMGTVVGWKNAGSLIQRLKNGGKEK